MAPFTRSQVSRATRDNITKMVDEYNRKIYEEQKREEREKKEQKKIEKAAEALMMLNRVPRVCPEPINHRPVTRSQR